MKKWLLAGMVAVVWGTQSVLALGLTPTDTPTPSLPKPLVFASKEKIPDKTNYSMPRSPRKYIDRSNLDLTNEENEVPQGPPIRNLGEPNAIQQVPSLNKEDRHSGRYYWHPYKEWNYCHFREGDRHWYGWRTGETFHWVLWRSGHFWWHDTYAERWLYFDRGYWWWQGPKPHQVQVFMEDGHYHSCDSNGVLGEDLMRTGTEEIATEPVAKPSPNPTPGQKQGRRHGGLGMGGGMGGS